MELGNRGEKQKNRKRTDEGNNNDNNNNENNNEEEEKDSKELKQDGWSIAQYDAMGVIQGGIFGSFAGPYGQLAGAIVGMALLSTVEYLAQNESNEAIGFYAGYNNNNLSINSPNSDNNFTHIDIRQPINPIYYSR